jgi:hypothetical protein
VLADVTRDIEQHQRVRAEGLEKGLNLLHELPP